MPFISFPHFRFASYFTVNFFSLPFAALAFVGVTSISCCLSKLLFCKWREGTFNVMLGP